MKLYVPNPQKWVDFFDRVSTGKANLNQSGAGRKPRVITVDQLKPIEDKKLSIKAVLPSEQTAAQAKSELERENINPKKVAAMFQSSSKRGRKRKSRSRSVHSAKGRRVSRKRQRGAGFKKSTYRKRSHKRHSKQSKKTSGKRDIFEIK